jgi:outer membrane protein assembly factor BamE
VKKILFVIISAFLITSCIHKMDIQQGNVITQETVNQLHPGMNEAKVREIMGNPLLLNTFSDQRIDYVYTYKPGHGQMTEKYVTLVFKGGILKEINGNMYSTYIK